MPSIDELLETGRSQYGAGDYAGATQAYAAVLQQDVGCVEAWDRLGMLMLRAGQLDVSIDCVSKAISFGGRTAERLYHLGLVYRAKQDLNQAEAAWRQSLEIDGGDSRALRSLGAALMEREQFDEAAGLFRRALADCPSDAQMRTALGDALQKQGLLDDAFAEYRAVLEIAPDCLVTLNSLAELFIAMGQFNQAMVVLYRALEKSPGSGDAHERLVQTQQRCVPEVVALFNAAVALDDCDVQFFESVGGALHIAGMPDLAVEAFRRASEIEPDNPVYRSKLIYLSQFLPDVTARAMADRYAEWDRHHCQPLISRRSPLNNDPDPNRRLRLGILSPSLYRHAAAWLSVRGFENLDRSLFETYFYVDSDKSDDIAERFKQVAGHWKEVFELTEREVVDSIHNDGIDVLIVMSGHIHTRAQAIAAHKPAPVQIAWTGDPSGQSAVDWLIADRFLIPDELEDFYTESILRMPHDYAVFEHPSQATSIGPCPSVTNGFVTFGSFNQTVKFHSALLENWARILQQFPQSRLLLIGQSNTANVEKILSPFVRVGIDANRIELHNRIARDRLLDSYNRVDVCLDTYPFSGGVTTLESMWMGVPVVSLRGETFAGRTSLSHLSNAGLEDLIAETPEEYAEIAVKLAQDTERLSQLRRDLRRQLFESPICDGPQFGRDLTAALRSAWRVWAEQQTGAD